jgi:glycosyltransferase 2 family protein
MRSRRSRWALSWGGLLVSAVFAYLAVRNVDFGEVWDGIRTSNYWWLLPALVMLAVCVYLKALRWRFLFARETRPGTGAVLSATLIGYFFNAILPARAGEAARVLALHRRAGTSRSEAAATVVVERSYDVLCLLLLLFVAWPWIPKVTWIHAAVALAVAVAVVLAAAIALLAIFGVRPVHFVLSPLRRLPFLSEERVDHIGEGLGRGLAALRHPHLVLGAFVWTTLAWLALAASTWLVMRGFHLHLSIVAAMLVVVATNIAQILPSSPSALGVFEAATLVALRAYDVPDSEALSYALVLHALNILPFLVAGLALLHGTIRARAVEAEQAALLADDAPLQESG